MKRVINKDLEALRSSGLFDEKYYLEQYPDVKLLGIDPLEHYLWVGEKMGRAPSAKMARLNDTPVINQGYRTNYLNKNSGDNKEYNEKIGSYEYCGEYSSIHNGRSELIPEFSFDLPCKFSGMIAIHLHLFHLEMAEKFRRYLGNIPVKFDLFVSLPEFADSFSVKEYFSKVSNASNVVVAKFPNRGRDISPMFVGFGHILMKYDLIGHIHSKKSDHTYEKRDWSTHLLHHLFHSKDHISSLLNYFSNNNNLGLIFPVYHPSLKNQIAWGANFAKSQQLAKKFGLTLDPSDLCAFPAGSFFLARNEALAPFFEAAFSIDDFDEEAGQKDGTLAHSIERMVAIIAEKRGFECLQVRAEKPHSLSTSYTRGSRYKSNLLDKIRSGEIVSCPAFSVDAPRSCRIAFFSCATGGYDQPLPFEAFIEGADYYFFTDSKIDREGFWKLTPVQYSDPINPIKTARYHKSQVHHLINEYDIAVWIDANISIVGDVSPFIEKVLKEDVCFGVIPHPYRNSCFEEAEKLIDLKADSAETINNQINEYRKIGYKGDNGLTETNFLIMNLGKPETRDALDVWWNEIKNNSHRDQLSFDYARWKANANSTNLLSEGLSIRADWRFSYFDHGNGEHPYLDTLPFLRTNSAAQAMPPSVDVVICIHNSPDDVERCLASLVRARDSRTRLILVDDGSDKATREAIDRHCSNHPGDILIRHAAARGYTKAANAGISHSTADYVILLNSDTIVPLCWVEALISAGESDCNIGILGPLSNAASWQSVPDVIDAAGDFAVNELPSGMLVDDAAKLCASISKDVVYRTPVINGFCFAIKRAVINKIGLLDEESFPQGYGEENDYCFRAVNSGFHCGLVTKTYVFHAKSKSFTHERRRILSAEGFQALVRKHSVERIEAAVGFMKAHPALAEARKDFALRAPEYRATVKPICFYLPQFHPFEINDRSWGEGFTEWTNVVKAEPLFPGHIQPKFPGKLGFYDLRLRETLQAQADLASQNGVYGFSIYYYRFGSERPMWKPIAVLLANPDIPINFCFCWANEDWTRAWDGKTKDIILKQDYSLSTIDSIIDDLVIASKDARYIRVDGRPLFMIYQINKLPDPEAILRRFRDSYRAQAREEIVIGTTYNDEFRPEWESLVDIIVQFPPHRTPRISKRGLVRPEDIGVFRPEREDYFEGYDQVVAQSLEVTDFYKKLHPGVCPDWDNSPRRPKNANVLVGSSPEKFGNWVSEASKAVQRKFLNGQIVAPFLFVNAWNEWAEGAILEPSQAYGGDYLRALSNNI
ncbi:MAG: glycoside hydrolase family 99-like domain-containing protein [Alphaproteobacteria bacterium]|nr:glycoside hydrolase family 99-like domain-containing protein [Alphaproteobacteria bacterium]MBU0877229.1 glycoside hydrolase family 99-like domain-containing protein [Alphaproteobacteria bacterium]MBU1770621.1 glycoside hydrolase family 99-like domain-containing protein [Alphaproteobacteria bacterium]